MLQSRLGKAAFAAPPLPALDDALAGYPVLAAARATSRGAGRITESGDHL